MQRLYLRRRGQAGLLEAGTEELLVCEREHEGSTRSVWNAITAVVMYR